MKYRVTMFRTSGRGREDEVKIVEADNYQRDGRTYTFFRLNKAIATYENVTRVEAEGIAEGG